MASKFKVETKVTLRCVASLWLLPISQDGSHLGGLLVLC